MNPIVAASAIGVGGTVVVGVAGFSAAIWNTRRTIKHARESRVWDRRADAYIEALAALNHRQIRREFETLTRPVDDRDRQRTQAYLTGYEQDSAGLEARLQAFASEPVHTAMRVGSMAHRDAIKAFESWQALAVMPGISDDFAQVVVRLPADPLADQARHTLGHTPFRPPVPPPTRINQQISPQTCRHPAPATEDR